MRSLLALALVAVTCGVVNAQAPIAGNGPILVAPSYTFMPFTQERDVDRSAMAMVLIQNVGGVLMANIVSPLGQATTALRIVDTSDNSTVEEVFNAHVHAKACDDQMGGGHWMINKSETAVLQSNEVWFSINQTTGTPVYSTPMSIGQLDDGAKSVVIHASDANKTRLVCADLVVYSLQCTSFKPVNASYTLTSGGVDVTNSMTGASARLQLTGVKKNNATYAGRITAHVHNAVCKPASGAAGGAHWHFNASITEDRADNEIWFVPAATALTAGAIDQTTSHTGIYVDARALSVIVHDADESGARMFCCDFWRNGTEVAAVVQPTSATNATDTTGTDGNDDAAATSALAFAVGLVAAAMHF